MSKHNHLIIFAKNPEPGKVKTRLANAIGDEKALFIYKILLAHTAKVTIMVNSTREVYYSDQIEENDLFESDFFSKNIQRGKDLGERMHNAFLSAKKSGKEKIIIIGTDCYDLDFTIIEKGFEELNKNDVVLGPALDGGYYLIGLKKPNASLFLNKTWSTENVLNEAISTCKTLDLKYAQLKPLSDIDNENDLGELAQLLKNNYEILRS